jgi:hypothetical protein
VDRIRINDVSTAKLHQNVITLIAFCACGHRWVVNMNRLAVIAHGSWHSEAHPSFWSWSFR